jgi:hypothetical protein
VQQLPLLSAALPFKAVSCPLLVLLLLAMQKQALDTALLLCLALSGCGMCLIVFGSVVKSGIYVLF